MEAQLADEHARFEAGEYGQTLQEWLHSSWQGDALQVCTTSPAYLPAYICPVQRPSAAEDAHWLLFEEARPSPGTSAFASSLSIDC